MLRQMFILGLKVNYKQCLYCVTSVCGLHVCKIGDRDFCIVAGVVTRMIILSSHTNMFTCCILIELDKTPFVHSVVSGDKTTPT